MIFVLSYLVRRLKDESEILFNTLDIQPNIIVVSVVHTVQKLTPS